MSDFRDWLSAGDAPPDDEPLREDPIFGQLDAVYAERVERGDPKWWPSGRDPKNLERLVRERQERRGS